MLCDQYDVNSVICLKLNSEKVDLLEVINKWEVSKLLEQAYTQRTNGYLVTFMQNIFLFYDCVQGSSYD